jgi:hypothetical protein
MCGPGKCESGGDAARANYGAVCGAVWSLATDLGFMPLPFLAIGAGCGACLALTCCLPASLRYSHGHAAGAGHERAARGPHGDKGGKQESDGLEFEALL